MKKFLAPFLVFLLISCSKEDSITTESDFKNQTQTYDPINGYKSPYDFNNLVDITYVFVNETDYTFEIRPFFGLAYFDGNFDPNQYFGVPLNPSVDAPMLMKLNNKYLNAIHRTKPITVLPHESFTSDSNGDLPNGMGNILDLYNATTWEKDNIKKYGKFYFSKTMVFNNPNDLDPNGYMNQRVGNYQLLQFPHDVDDATSNTDQWIGLPGVMSYMNESNAVIFSNLSREMCLPIYNTDNVLDIYTFSHAGSNFECGIKFDDTKLIFYLIKV